MKLYMPGRYFLKQSDVLVDGKKRVIIIFTDMCLITKASQKGLNFKVKTVKGYSPISFFSTLNKGCD